MILEWMLWTILFTACVALGAAAAEPFARALGRPIRWIWSAALLAASLWPVLAPVTALALPGLRRTAIVLPIMQVVPRDGVLLGHGSPHALEIAGQALLVLWALASLLLIVRLVRAFVVLHRLRKRAEPASLDDVPVLLTDSVGPAAIGLRRRAVIIPRRLLELDAPLLRLVLHHEREHCTAGDSWLLLGASLAVVLFPWNLVLWLTARRLHLALEMDCDARVLAAGAEPTRYGQLLLWIAQWQRATPLVPTLATPPSHLERRIIAMRTRLIRPRPLSLVAAGALLVIAVVGACSAGPPDGPLARKSAAVPEHQALTPTATTGPYFEFQVEEQVRPISNGARPRYPSAMRDARREGEVLAQFVVDQDGVPNLSTFKALRSSDPAFADAVRQALPSMRFMPARIGGAAVSQIVQQLFTFASSTTR
jgi:hypothetical protein